MRLSLNRRDKLRPLLHGYRRRRLRAKVASLCGSTEGCGGDKDDVIVERRCMRPAV